MNITKLATLKQDMTLFSFKFKTKEGEAEHSGRWKLPQNSEALRDGKFQSAKWKTASISTWVRTAVFTPGPPHHSQAGNQRYQGPR